VPLRVRNRQLSIAVVIAHDSSARIERYTIATWVCVLSVLLGGSDAGAAKLEIVVPAYFYPSAGSDWNDLNAAAGKVPITAIMNPFNGPGNSLDGNYASAVNSLRAAGGRVIGYVYTSYNARPLQQVVADVNKYDTWYNVDGIFVDEMANTGPAERLDYYRDIYNHVKSIDATWQVMGNPGTTTIEQYLTWPTADRLMVFENVGTSYPSYAPSSWNFNYNQWDFVHLVHTEPSSANMLTDLQLAVQRNAGGIYVTDDVLANPWDRVPNYWTALVDAVATINADYNGNGVVDSADYTLWRDSLGATGLGLSTDGNGDGTVNQSDYTFWKSHFGQTASSAAAGQISEASSVPEPASAKWLFVAPSAFLCLRRRR
jgi:Spherulation-specific family 4/Dockerin type I domain